MVVPALRARFLSGVVARLIRQLSVSLSVHDLALKHSLVPFQAEGRSVLPGLGHLVHHYVLRVLDWSSVSTEPRVLALEDRVILLEGHLMKPAEVCCPHVLQRFLLVDRDLLNDGLVALLLGLELILKVVILALKLFHAGE